MIVPAFSWSRFSAIIAKEFVQMRRDRLTFAMMIGIPLLQLILFGFAINSDPKHLPAAVLCRDPGTFARTIVEGIRRSDYFSMVKEVSSEAESEALLAAGKVQFVLNIPENFSRSLVRGERPAVLLEADATDPAATSNAIGAVQLLASEVLDRDLKGVLSPQRGTPASFELRVHRRYNPEAITQYNVVPGLMGVVLTMTMVMATALGITRERERGTMENLLATPVQPLEVMIGKIMPYIIVGFIQALLVLFAAVFFFNVPMIGSMLLLFLCSIVFIAANLMVGITFSTVSKNQLQALQLSFFFFLPSIILSGFMFPYRGMPDWAQALGSILPLTHFLRIVRGILLKGNGPADIWPHLAPILVFTVAVTAFGLSRYRKTLD